MILSLVTPFHPILTPVPCQHYFLFLLCTFFDSFLSSEGSDKKGDLGLILFYDYIAIHQRKDPDLPTKNIFLQPKELQTKSLRRLDRLKDDLVMVRCLERAPKTSPPSSHHHLIYAAVMIIYRC